jgi:hypothetical protein
MLKKIFLLFSFYLALNSNAFSLSNEEPIKKTYIIYNEETYTVRDLFFPITYYMNTTFDVLQMRETFPQGGYLEKHRLVLERMADPVGHIKKDGGAKKFFHDEWATIRVMPNIGLHLVGAGYDYRMIAEWYDAHGFLAPYFLSLLTVYAVHLGNEALETAGRHITSHDNLADLYFFDAAGVILFLFEPVAKFFQNTMHLRDWWGQPIVDPKTGTIFNASANYMMRPALFGEFIMPITLMGIQNLAGFSINIFSQYYLSILGGVTIPDPAAVTFRAMAGVYIDKNGALIASLIFNGSENFRIKLNIYPEVFGHSKVRLGFFSALDFDNRFWFGITSDLPVGLGS